MIVVDTQAVIWLTEEPSRLSEAAQKALSQDRRDGGPTIADITLREIAMIVSRARVKVSAPLNSYLDFVESVFTVMPVTARIAEISMGFGSTYPKDRRIN